MPYLGPARVNRPWRVLVLVVIAFLLLTLAFALWSEEEDTENLTPAEVGLLVRSVGFSLNSPTPSVRRFPSASAEAS
jgi:glycerol uptake facilitator-like aquaporin